MEHQFDAPHGEGPATLHRFDQVPPPAVRLLWCDWIRRHGADPNDVVLPGWIERRERECQIHYLAPWRDDRGRPVFDPVLDDFVRVPRVFQLEAPPLPFPVPSR